MQEFLSALLGGQTAPQFFGNVFFSLLGVALLFLVSTTFRDIDSKRTPTQFSWRFFLKDNLRRFLSGLIILYLALRFTPELFSVEISNWFAVIIGLSSDSIAYVIKEKVKAFKSKAH